MLCKELLYVLLRPTRRKKADLSLGFDSDEDCVIGFQLYRLPCTYIYMFWPFFFQESKRAWVIPSKVEPLYTCWWTDGHVPGKIFFFKLKLHYLQFRDLALVFLHRKEIVP